MEHDAGYEQDYRHHQDEPQAALSCEQRRLEESDSNHKHSDGNINIIHARQPAAVLHNRTTLFLCCVWLIVGLILQNKNSGGVPVITLWSSAVCPILGHPMVISTPK